MLSKSFHRVSRAAPTPNLLWHQLFRRGGGGAGGGGRRWLGDVTDVCRRRRGTVMGRQERAFFSFPPHLALPPPDNLGSTLLHLWLRTGRDQLRGVGEGRRATCQVKLPPTTKKKPHTIKLRHVLSLNTITWPLRVDNPLKPDQRKSEF